MVSTATAIRLLQPCLPWPPDSRRILSDIVRPRGSLEGRAFGQKCPVASSEVADLFGLQETPRPQENGITERGTGAGRAPELCLFGFPTRPLPGPVPEKMSSYGRRMTGVGGAFAEFPKSRGTPC